MGKTRSQRWRKANATRRKLSDKRGFDAKTKLKFKKGNCIISSLIHYAAIITSSLHVSNNFKIYKAKMI